MVKGWLSIFVVGMLLAGPAYAADKAPAKEQKGETDLTLTSQKDKVSYIIGLDVGSRLKSQSIDVDQSIFARGLKDGIAGNKPFLSEEEIRATMTSFNEELKKKHDEEVKKTAAKNKEEGEKFLAENKKKEGVVTLPDGLQYKIIKEGDGPKPKETDTVTVNYVGKLVNGTEFDSSVKRGQPATFPVNGVIAGWKEALPMMKVGSKWELFIPPQLAYGEKGAGAVIGPDSTLIFEVELLSIKEPGKTPEKPQGHPQDMHH
jgi:FKBP-type peptidyl-prolyl cis-trans isomerase FklB